MMGRKYEEKTLSELMLLYLLTMKNIKLLMCSSRYQMTLLKKEIMTGSMDMCTTMSVSLVEGLAMYLVRGK